MQIKEIEPLVNNNYELEEEFLIQVIELESSLQNIVELYKSGFEFDEDLINIYTQETKPRFFYNDYLSLKYYLYFLQQIKNFKNINELYCGRILLINIDSKNPLLEGSDVVQKIANLEMSYESMISTISFSQPIHYEFSVSNISIIGLMSKIKNNFDNKPRSEEAIEAYWLFLWKFLRFLGALEYGQFSAKQVIEYLTNNLKSDDDRKKIETHYPETINLITSFLELLKKNEQEILINKMKNEKKSEKTSLFFSQKTSANMIFKNEISQFHLLLIEAEEVLNKLKEQYSTLGNNIQFYSQNRCFDNDFRELKFNLHCIQQLKNVTTIEELYCGDSLPTKPELNNPLLLQNGALEKINTLNQFYEDLINKIYPPKFQEYLFIDQEIVHEMMLKLTELFIENPKTDEAIEPTWLFNWHFIRYIGALETGQLAPNYIIDCLTKSLKDESMVQKIDKQFPELISLAAAFLKLLKINEMDKAVARKSEVTDDFIEEPFDDDEQFQKDLELAKKLSLS